MIDSNAKIFELLDEELDLVFFRVATHVSKLFVLVTGYDFVNGPGNSIGNCDLGFVGRAQLELPLIVLGSVKRASLQFGAVSSLDKELSKMRRALSTF